MGETKYITSMGIAFAEESDFKVLSKYAKKGWIVKRFKAMGYELEKGTAEDVIFSIDVRLLKGEELEEYLEMFAVAGWEHVTSQHDIHLFKAARGTSPIYTDNISKKEKQKRMRITLKPVVAVSATVAILSYGITEISTGMLNSFFQVVYVLSLIVALPMGMTLLATYYHAFRIK